jgi:hypothetical protein
MYREDSNFWAWVACAVMLSIIIAGISVNFAGMMGNEKARKFMCEYSLSSAPGYCTEYWIQKLKTK